MTDAMVIAYVIVFSLIGSVGALLGAGLLLLFPRAHERFKAGLLSYAIGTLLGAAFLGLLPSAIEKQPASAVLSVTLSGLVVFFFLEKIIRLPHAHAHGLGEKHDRGHPAHVQPAAPLILVGDAFHNFVDGVLIATAFLVSVPLGILTSLAVVAHEIPQELGDFVILIESGMERMKAFWLNFLSALATFAGAMLTWAFRSAVEPYTPYLLAVSASSFIYIAMVDLAPILHHGASMKSAARQMLGLLIGIGTIAGLHQVLG